MSSDKYINFICHNIPLNLDTNNELELVSIGKQNIYLTYKSVDQILNALQNVVSWEMYDI